MPLSGTKEFLEYLKEKRCLPIGDQMKELRGKEVTEDYFIKNGFNKPIMVRRKKGLRIVLPESPFSVEDVVHGLGKDYILDVIDVVQQDQYKMKIGEFLDYFRESEPRSKLLNVLSLEISHTKIAHLVEPPYVIKEMSIVEKLWPCDNIYQRANKPSVQKYCLMSMKDSWTDFHIDFGGSSVWYHMYSGRKIFYLIPPKRRYIKAYTNWMGEYNNRMLFFPDQIKKFSSDDQAEVYKLEIKSGDTILLPAGWIHAVHTLEDSLVFGGNFVHSLSIPLQLKIYKIERFLQTEDRFLFPYFEKLHWFVAEYILHKLEANLTHNIPPIKLILKGALKLIETLPDWLTKYHTPLEVTVIHVGQGGIQMGNAIWELICIEHSICPDGECVGDKDAISMETFFQEVKGGKYNPRAIFVDTEPTVINEIATGGYRGLFHPNQLISGKEDASNNFARGSFVCGPMIIKEFRKKLRKIVEQSNNLESFLLFNSTGGGTGSGLSALAIEQLVYDYRKKFRVQMPIFSSPHMSSAIVEPYNVVLHNHATLDSVDICILFDNEALLEMCNKLLLINFPTFVNINRIIASMVSSVTCSLRYNTAAHISLRDIRTNVVPYPRIHFPLLSIAPVHPFSRTNSSNFSIEEITKNVFSKTHQSLKCDTTRGRFISIMLNYRGSVNPKEVSDAVVKQKSTMKNFVEWCPTGLKIGINVQPPIVSPESFMAPSDKGVTMICNSTAIKQVWSRIGKKYDLLFRKRAFIHWFITEGMEEAEFGESRIDLKILEEDYHEIGLNEVEIIEQECKLKQNNTADDIHDAEMDNSY